MKVNIIHPNLNLCGGGERLSLATMHAVFKIGAEFDITTYELPDKKRLQESFGDYFSNIVQKAGSVNILQSALDHHQSASPKQQKYDVVINTHVDALPHYLDSYSKIICYCHFPTAIAHIESMNEDYLRETRTFNAWESSRGNGYSMDKKKIYFQRLLESYSKVIENSTVLTNSEFSKKAIYERLGVSAKVLYPPVETRKFRSVASSKDRDNIILVLCRIVPYKTVENAISIAKILKQNKVGEKMIIIGNMYDDDYITRNYYTELIKMVRQAQLDEFVSFQINLPLDIVIENMRKSSIYLHTQAAEHFGMSTVEAMSAGLIPIVPGKGGHAEFVPRKYHFNTIEKAARIISGALSTPMSERLRMSQLADRFSTENYLNSLQSIVKSL